MSEPASDALRALILTPNRRDAALAAEILAEASIEAWACADLAELTVEMARGVGFALIAEEAVAVANVAPLNQWVAEQPVWSDLPFVLLTRRRSGGLDQNPLGLRLMKLLGNVTLIERPFHPLTLVSIAEAALRARRRQYETRRMLEELARATAALRHSQDALRQANEALEARVQERTGQLAEANARLTREIAERERAQAALLQSQKMEAMGQLTGGIAHDFNNLLTAVIGNLDLIGRRAVDERILSMADQARKAAERAAKLTTQLLAFSRDQRLNLRPIRIDELIRGMSDLLDRSLGPLVEIRTELGAGDALALGDPNQVELAILNLAINARDAMTDGGVLTISTAAGEPDKALVDGRYVRISVSDTGHGVPADLLPRVFDPFFTTKPTGKGTGLGLSQVYGIATQSGGAVRIDSPPGHGATVTMLLPQVSAELLSAADAARADGSALDGGEERVLVIDDDPDVRRFICTCLAMVGYQVTEAPDGRAGLARLDLDEPDLLVVDFAMPGLNGAEVAAAARQRRPAMPILLASGYAETDAVQKVLDARDVLRKPFDVSSLLAAVRKALDGADRAGAACRADQAAEIGQAQRP